ncbi:MAG: DUF4272 domain-containing protein [Saccharospirillum sp.]|uniref:DUF4272 domain-containing protein n=1 Tax=Saccharospirillum sp. TaxID=2033801 RepID=UPI003298A80C
MDLEFVRDKSKGVALKYGIHIPATLPFLESALKPRPINEIVDRALANSVVVAASYGFNKESAFEWLNSESLVYLLSPQELNFLSGNEENIRLFNEQVEALYSFSWSLNQFTHLDFSRECPDNLVKVYPDLIAMESDVRFRENTKLRPVQELIEMCDLAYCMHWGIKQADIDGVKLKTALDLFMAPERRRALEWMLGNEEWDEVPLDT